MSFTDEEILAQLLKTADGEYITPQTELWQIDPEGMIEEGGAWRVDNVFSYQRLDDYPVFSSQAAAKRSIRDASQVAADQYEHVKNLVGCLAELLAAVTSAGHWSNDGESYTFYGDTHGHIFIESIIEKLKLADELLDTDGHVSFVEQVPSRVITMGAEPAIRKTPLTPSLSEPWHNDADLARIKDLESHIVGRQVKAESREKLIKQQVAHSKSLQEALHEARAALDDEVSSA